MSLAIAEIDREARVLDLELAARLDFVRPRAIRQMIANNRAELEQYGVVVFRETQTTAKGGRPTSECWLNEGQALLLCMFSQTNRAAAVRKELIDVFMAWRQKTVTVRRHNRRPPTPRTVSRRPLSFSLFGTERGDGMCMIEGCVPERVALALSVMALESWATSPVMLEGVFQ